MEQQQEPQAQTPPTVGFPSPIEPDKKGFNLLIPIVLLLLVVFGGIGFFIFKSSRSAQEEPSPTPALERVVQEPTPKQIISTPTATTAAVDRSKIKIQVLNGTGTSGDAGSVQSALANLGYKNIETGNATSTDAIKTTVTFDTSLPDTIVNEVSAKLKTIFKDVTVRTAKLTNFQVQITTGPKLGSSTTTSTTSPTVSASPSATPSSNQ